MSTKFWGFTRSESEEVEEFELRDVEGLTSDHLENGVFFANLKGFRQVFISEAVYNRIQKAKEKSYVAEQA